MGRPIYTEVLAGVAKFRARVLLGRDHEGLGLGSTQGIEKTRGLLYDNTTSRPLPEQGLVALCFVRPVALVDHDSSTFRDHCMSQVTKWVQAR